MASSGTQQSIKILHNKIRFHFRFTTDEVEVVEIENRSRLKNEKFMTLPCVIHGNGPSKVCVCVVCSVKQVSEGE